MRGDFRDESRRFEDIDRAALKEAERRIAVEEIRVKLHALMSELHAEWEAMEPMSSVGETARADISQASTLIHMATHRLDSALARMGRRARAALSRPGAGKEGK